MTDTIEQQRDAINGILGVQPGSPIAAIREQFPQNQAELQTYYDAIFAPTESSLLNLPLPTRLLVAIRTAAHAQSEPVERWYTARALEAGANAAGISAAKNMTAAEAEDPVLEAAYRHTDLLSTHPVDATPEALVALAQVGLTPAGIVTLSQVVAFVSYQVRLVALLRAVGEIS